MLDHFIAKNATAHEVNSYYTFAIFYCTFCVQKHTILGPAANHSKNVEDQSRVGLIYRPQRTQNSLIAEFSV